MERQLRFIILNIFLIFLVPIISTSQTKEYKKYMYSDGFKFLTDYNNPLLSSTNKLQDIIVESKKYDYYLQRSNDGGYVFNNGYFNYVTLIKDIKFRDSGNQLLLLPEYSFGSIYKRVFYSGDSVEDADIFKVQTEIKLIGVYGYPETTASAKNYLSTITKFIEEKLRIKFDIDKKSKKFNDPFEKLQQGDGLKNIFSADYDVADVINYSETSTSGYKFKKIFNSSLANKTELVGDNYNNIQYLIFSFQDEFYNSQKQRYINFVNDSNNRKDNSNFLKFNIGGVDIRKVNVYDLESMVKIFLEDCLKNNINTPSISTLKATFEPLDDGVIAYAFGRNNDNAIIIKVDPARWSNASIEKKWYILYHELGHDVLNLTHGSGGKMMYNFADRDYTWDEFFKDKDYMFNAY